MEGPIATILATNYSILDTFKNNMQTWRVSALFLCSVLLLLHSATVAATRARWGCRL